MIWSILIAFILWGLFGAIWQYNYCMTRLDTPTTAKEFGNFLKAGPIIWAALIWYWYTTPKNSYGREDIRQAAEKWWRSWST